MKIKNRIKKIIPLVLYKLYIKYKLYRNTNELYRIDKKRFVKSITLLENKENIESRIIINYHSIEKGLTNINFREGFGKTALKELTSSLEEYVEHGFPQKDKIFQIGLSVLRKYVDRHIETKTDTSELEEFINRFNHNSYDLNAGIEVISKRKIISTLKKDFYDFSLSRSSVRDYLSKSVDKTTLNKVFKLAAHTPSVCNRQPWGVYVIKDINTIDSVLSQQKGFKGYGDNLSTLIVIISNNRFFTGAHERNQGFIDSGMYSMNLLYALHYYELAACALNANLSIESDKEVRNILNIPENENIIMFIAVGYYKENNLTTASLPKEINSYVKYL